MCGWLVKNGYPSGYQVLCHNCNSLKSWPARTSVKRAAKFRLEDALKEETISAYSDGSNRCNGCGRDDIRLLGLDHPAMDGAAHRRSLNVIGGKQMYRKLRADGFPPGYQILCFSCNLADYLERKSKERP